VRRERDRVSFKTRFGKWLRFLILGIAAIFSPVDEVAATRSQPARAEQPKVRTVYVARTGKKYHRDGCRYLAQGKTPMTLKDAKAKGYTPCKVCRAPDE
jgi:hypothetical protein